MFPDVLDLPPVGRKPSDMVPFESAIPNVSDIPPAGRQRSNPHTTESIRSDLCDWHTKNLRRELRKLKAHVFERFLAYSSTSDRICTVGVINQVLETLVFVVHVLSFYLDSPCGLDHTAETGIMSIKINSKDPGLFLLVIIDKG